MAGVGVETQMDGFSKCLAKYLADDLEKTVHWQVIAKSGYNAVQVREELVPQLPDSALDVIVIGLSVNDTIERNSPMGWRQDLIQLIKAIRQKQPICPIVLIHRGPVEFFPAFPPAFKFILGTLIKWQWRAIGDLPTLFHQFYVIKDVIRFEDWSQKADSNIQASDFFSDGVHPSKMTYQIWAAEVAEFIQKRKLL